MIFREFIWFGSIFLNLFLHLPRGDSVFMFCLYDIFIFPSFFTVYLYFGHIGAVKPLTIFDYLKWLLFISEWCACVNIPCYKLFRGAWDGSPVPCL